MPEEPKLTDTQQAFYDAQLELRHLGAGVPSTINRNYLCELGDGAHKNGGCAAIISAIVGDISGCVRNPTEQMLFALGMVFAQKILAKATEEAKNPHVEPEPPEVPKFSE